MKIKKGDKVLVLSGKDKNKTGLVEKVITKTNEVIVSGVNIAKKAVKPSKKYPNGGVVDVIKPLAVSRVELVCPACGKPTRIGYEIKGKEKARVCKKCGKAIVATKEKEGK